MSQVTTDYDSPWKEALEVFFPDFMAFFSPTPTPTSTGQRVTSSWTRSCSR